MFTKIILKIFFHLKEKTRGARKTTSDSNTWPIIAFSIRKRSRRKVVQKVYKI